MITENLSTLEIHKLTQKQFDREFAAGNLKGTALYLTPDNSITVWQPNTKYEVGDVVIATWENEDKEETVIAKCNEVHTSSASFTNDLVVYAVWDMKSINAYGDEYGRNIYNTYATKKEIGDIETALDNIIVIQNQLIDGNYSDLKKGTIDNYSIYLESEKDDTKISLAFTDVRPPEKEDYIGIYNRAEYIGKNATALGTSVAKGDRSLTSGSSNLVEGKGAIALGTDNLVISASSAALGYANFVNGEMSVALGASNVARNKYAVALNGFNDAYGKNSLATGNHTSAIGNYTLTGGQGTYATGGASVALGNSTKAEGECSFTTGYETQSNEFCQTVVGRHNNLDKSKNALFVVGNGYDTDDEDKPIKRNAFTVNMDGTATLSKDPVYNMDVATKQYVDSQVALKVEEVLKAKGLI